MHDQQHYLYAFTGADCTLESPIPGVDTRFNVELLRRELLAAVASRVGRGWFEPARLQGKTAADVEWSNRLAIRHNHVICEAARSSPVMPLKLGTLFRSRSALLTRMAGCEAAAADFLRRLGDRQEWAVRIYQGVRWAEAAPGHAAVGPPHYAMGRESGGQGPAPERVRHADRPASDCRLREEVLAVESTLRDHADRWRRVHAPPAGRADRHEKLAWNAAFLLPRSGRESWLTAVERLRRDVAARGLFLEVTGPWPPYHFCPALET